MTSSYDVFITTAPQNALTVLESILRQANYSVAALPGRILRVHRHASTSPSGILASLAFDLQIFDGPNGSAVARLFRPHPVHTNDDPGLHETGEQQFRAQVASLSVELARIGNRNSTTL
jgi:hypothetical protein